jgi:HEAT repeat protein
MIKIDIECARLVLQIAICNAVDAMEAAKAVIRRGDPDATGLLVEVATNRSCRRWSRIAAVSALGFLKSKHGSTVLLRILKDVRESPELRAHVAEALGNIRERRALSVLSRILMSKGHLSLKRSCVYAVSQIPGQKALTILRQFKSTNPRRILLRETEAALESR